MTETTRCEHCGVLDALGRHDGACPYAVEVGLPRLAEGEPPIDPEDPDEGELGPEDPNLESGYDGPVAEEGEVSPNHPAHPQWHDQPGAIQRAPSQATHSLIRERPAEAPELWVSYRHSDGSGGEDGFDAVVFATELDALRHAVREGYNVRQLELGRSIREQADA
jgi:hypothetical protein